MPDNGGVLAPKPFIPYSRQWVSEEDIEAVAHVLRSDWLTTGPEVDAFESDLAAVTGAAEAVAVSSGTAALHAALHALGVGPGDEVVVPALTFVATANAAAYLGARPVFADVDPETLLIDPQDAAAKITERTKAIVAVDYAGQPCDYDALRRLADRHGVALVADACHSLGASYKGKPVGCLADLTCFSFHPVKPIASGEGGAVTTDAAEFAERMRHFRNHGIDTDHRQRARAGVWSYEMVELGYNYRMSDIHAALGRSQLRRLGEWTGRRRAIAGRYDEAFSAVSGLSPLRTETDRDHAYHLYVVRVESERDRLFSRLREAGIGAQVHYTPVHLHPFYRDRFGTKPGDCPAAEAASRRVLSLPLFPMMTDQEQNIVVSAVTGLLNGG